MSCGCSLWQITEPLPLLPPHPPLPPPLSFPLLPPSNKPTHRLVLVCQRVAACGKPLSPWPLVSYRNPCPATPLSPAPKQTHTQAGAGVSSGCSLWQITEPLPLLSAEPALAEGILEDGQSFIELVNSVDTAINALLNGQQVGAAAGFSC